MKPFECDFCKGKVKAIDAVVSWNYDRPGKKAGTFRILHAKQPCSSGSPELPVNRSLSLEYVFQHMPEFISYIKRLDPEKKQLKDFVHRIEKDRSYIRRHNVDKKEVKKLIIRLEGADAE